MNHSTKDCRKQEGKLTYQERINQAKQLSLEMSSVYIDIGISKAMNPWIKRGNRMKGCGEMIMARKCCQCNKVHGTKVAMACNMRLCALCALRRSRAVAAQALEAMKWIEEKYGEDSYIPYLLTLTQVNCREGDLKEEIGRLLEAMAKLRHRRGVARQVIGAARTIEVTHNHKDHTWHPHIHMILLVKKEGIKKSLLPRQGFWESLWAEIMGLDYRPQIRIDRLKNKEKAVFEVSKYCTKFNKLLKGVKQEEACKLIEELDGAIYDRTLQVWSGAWREARKALKQKDPERMTDSELAGKAKECPSCGGAIINALMEWSGMEYQDSEAPESIYAGNFIF